MKNIALLAAIVGCLGLTTLAFAGEGSGCGAKEAKAEKAAACSTKETKVVKAALTHSVFKVDGVEPAKAEAFAKEAFTDVKGVKGFEVVAGKGLVRVTFESKELDQEKVKGMLTAKAEGATVTAPTLYAKTVKVEGMTCQGCVRKVQKTLNGVENVGLTLVSLEKGEATVHCLSEEVSMETLTAAVKSAGFEVPATEASPEV